MPPSLRRGIFRRALEFLRDDDPETYAAIAPQMESWIDMTLVHRNERVTIDGVGFAAIGRLKLLQLLQERVRAVGVEPQFGRVVASLDEFADADLIVVPTASIRWCAVH